MKICIYGASSSSLKKEYYDAAAELGTLIARGGHSLIFGGGQEGLMGACAKAVHAEGGSITGIAPKFFDEPGILYDKCSEFIFTETMSERKQLMENKADAFIILPGGIGTFEEFFETLTLKQLGRHCKPMAMLSSCGYYDRLMDMLGYCADEAFMSRDCLELFGFCREPSEALEYIQKPCSAEGSIRRLTDYSK